MDVHFISDEFNVREQKNSMDSQLAKALLGKRLDDEISVLLREKQKTYFMTAVDYVEYE